MWDPSSAVYAEGASEYRAASPASCNVNDERRDRGGGVVMAFPGARANTRDCQREKGNRRKYVGADADQPVEMDWKEVMKVFRGFQADWAIPPFLFQLFLGTSAFALAYFTAPDGKNSRTISCPEVFAHSESSCAKGWSRQCHPPAFSNVVEMHNGNH